MGKNAKVPERWNAETDRTDRQTDKLTTLRGLRLSVSPSLSLSTYIYIYVSPSISLSLYIYIFIFIHMYIHTYIKKYIHIHMYIRLSNRTYHTELNVVQWHALIGMFQVAGSIPTPQCPPHEKPIVESAVVYSSLLLNQRRFLV